MYVYPKQPSGAFFCYWDSTPANLEEFCSPPTAVQHPYCLPSLGPGGWGWRGEVTSTFKNRSMKELSAFPTVPHEILQQLSGVVNIESIRHQHRDTGPTLMPQAQNQWIHLADQLGKKKQCFRSGLKATFRKLSSWSSKLCKFLANKNNSNCWLQKNLHCLNPLKPGGFCPTQHPLVKQSQFVVKPLAIPYD